MAKALLSHRATAPLDESPLTFSGASQLALNLHAAPSAEAVIAALSEGLRVLGLRHALYAADFPGSVLTLRTTMLSPSMPVPDTIAVGENDSLEPRSNGAAYVFPDGVAPPFVAPSVQPIKTRSARARDAGTWVVLPLGEAERCIGCLLLFDPRLSEATVPPLTLLARHAALALERLSALEQASQDMRRVEQLAWLYESVRTLSASLPVGELLLAVAESGARLTGAEWGLIRLADDDRTSLMIAQRWPSSALLPVSLSASENELAERTAATGKGALLEAVPSKGRRRRGVRASGAVLVAPLLAKGEVIGVLSVASNRNRAFTDKDQQLLEAFAAQAATAVENGRLFQQVSDGKRAWEQTFDAIADGICLRDHRCRVLRANRALARIAVRPMGQLIGQRLCDLIPDLPEKCNVCKATQFEDDERLAELIELSGPGPDAVLLALRDYPVRIGDRGIERWVTVIKDVTVERRMQDALIRSEKMRALGEMATGIAHDFNNLLAAILGRAELSLLEEACADGHRAFETIRRAALDGVATVQRIQDYSRVRQDIARRKVDLCEIASTAVELARHKWKDSPERSGIRLDLAMELLPVPPVWGNPPELREVLMNLIFNAVDAMPKGGRMAVSTRVVGDRAMVTVADTGLGMSEEVKRRIFDPFFTTKGEAGSGLGLAVSYGIVARYGGDIVVVSSPGDGSAFTVRMPVALANQELPSGDAEVLVAALPPSRILLVDDDPDVLDSVAGLLRRDGHVVTALDSSREALDGFKAHSFDYLIIDLGMPDMNGWDLARGVRTVDLDVPIILLTGWHAELTNERAEAHGVTAVLSKPCTLADLRRVMLAHPAQARSVQHTERSGERHLRILIVDDQMQFAQTLAQRLGLEGHEVQVAHNGEQGIALAQEGRFDLALVDFRLPDMSGVDVVASLREAGRARYLVLATGMAVAPDDSRLRCKADRVLPKPWTSEELNIVLSEAAQRAWAEKTARDRNGRRTR